MTDQVLTNPAPLHRRLAVAAALALVAVLALLAIPATGQAKSATKFGADLSYDPTPVAAAQPCSGVAGQPCTRVPMYYYSPGDTGSPNAPKDGTIRKIKLISATPGSFRLELARNQAPSTGVAKVQAQGPKVTYQGTGQVETFDVNVPVKKGQWLGINATYLGALHCVTGMDFAVEEQYEPTLAVGGPFSQATSYSACTPLIQAVVR